MNLMLMMTDDAELEQAALEVRNHVIYHVIHHVNIASFCDGVTSLIV